MKRTLTFLCLSFILFLLYSGSIAEALCVRVSAANIRSGPGTHYEVVWKVYKYMPFQKVGKSLSGNWYAVRDVDGDVNWISGNLVRSDVRCGVVKKARSNVRKGPGLHYRKTSWSPVQQYSSFRVVGHKGAWVKVRSEWGEVGWIYQKNLWVK